MNLLINIKSEENDLFEVDFNNVVKKTKPIESNLNFNAEAGSSHLTIRQRVIASNKSFLYKLIHGKLLMQELAEIIEMLWEDNLFGIGLLKDIEIRAYRVELYIEVEMTEDTIIELNLDYVNFCQNQSLKKPVFNIKSNPAIKTVQIKYIKDDNDLERKYRVYRHSKILFGILVELIMSVIAWGAINRNDKGYIIIIFLIMFIVAGAYLIGINILKNWYCDLKKSFNQIEIDSSLDYLTPREFKENTLKKVV